MNLYNCISVWTEIGINFLTRIFDTYLLSSYEKTKD